MIGVQLVDCLARIPIGNFNSPIELARVALSECSVHARAELRHIRARLPALRGMRLAYARNALRPGLPCNKRSRSA